MKKKKILFIDHDPNISGSSVSMRYILRGFYEAGWDVLILSPKNENKLKFFQKYIHTYIKLNKNFSLDLHFTNNLPLHSLRGIKNNIYILYYFIRGIIYASRKINYLKPDLVYINEYVLSQFSVAGKILKVPVVTHIRSPILKGTYGFRRYLFSKLLLKCNDLIFAITKQDAAQIYRENFKSNNNVKVIFEFLDENDFAIPNNIDFLKKDLSIPNEVTVLLMLGGIEFVKGTYEAILAFSKVFEMNSKVHLIIAGTINSNINYNNKCFNTINEKKLNTNISIIGYSDRVHDLISCSDIVLSCSIKSHFSRPIIEAWSQRKPVISSDVEHSKEIIEDEKDGLLYKLDKPEELKDKIISLLNQPEKQKSLGEAGYLKACNLFTIDRNVNKIVDYCSSLL
jgi:glycosyltransferase involved in cell wall biosynthesis